MILDTADNLKSGRKEPGLHAGLVILNSDERTN
jgi:hypothetical protein